MQFNNKMFHAERALVLCAHTDDEYGCAGTILKLIESGVEIRYIALSRCEASVPEGFPIDILEKECKECTSKLGLRPENVEVWQYPVRHFPEYRQDILEKFVKIKNEYRPDLVFVSASSDIHQDHSVVYEEGFRAFKFSSILGYELPQNIHSFINTAFVRLSKENLDRKIEALSCYKSQYFRKSSQDNFIRSLAMVRGVQCDAEFAEGFELIRLIV